MTHIDLLQIVGKNIKQARIEKGMKGETLGKALQIGKAAISQMEHGEMDFRISRLFRIAEILDIDIYKLISLQAINSKTELENIIVSQQAILIDSTIIKQLLNELKINPGK